MVLRHFLLSATRCSCWAVLSDKRLLVLSCGLVTRKAFSPADFTPTQKKSNIIVVLEKQKKKKIKVHTKAVVRGSQRVASKVLMLSPSAFFRGLRLRVGEHLKHLAQCGSEMFTGLNNVFKLSCGSSQY